MKRTVIAVLLAVISFNICTWAYDADEVNKSGVFSELGVGVTCGDNIDVNLGLSLGVGYRYHFGNGFNWDMLKVTYYNPFVTDDFEESHTLRFITAFRYNSVPVIADKSLYGTFGAGYQMNVKDFDYWHGFAYEIGAGVILSPKVSLGLVWEGNVAHYNLGIYGSENVNFGNFGVKLGVAF